MQIISAGCDDFVFWWCGVNFSKSEKKPTFELLTRLMEKRVQSARVKVPHLKCLLSIKCHFFGRQIKKLNKYDKY